MDCVKVICITGIQANLPALQAAFGAIRHKGCDAHYLTGDAIGLKRGRNDRCEEVVR